MTRVRSAVDLVSEPPAGRALVAFAAACGQRAVGLWTAADDPRLAGALREALAATWRCAETGERPAAELVPALTDELDEDADFGDFHAQRMDALVTVAHAADAAGALGDDAAVLREATAAARSEIRIVEGSYQERMGGHAGATEHVSVARQLGWQRDDLTVLAADGPPERIVAVRSRAARAAILLRAGVLTGDWTGSAPGLDEPALF